MFVPVQQPIWEAPYGSAQIPTYYPEEPHWAKKYKSQKRMNLPAIIANIFLPCLLFTVVFAIMSFSIHYKHQKVGTFVAFLGTVLVCFAFYLAYKTQQKKNHGLNVDPSWYYFSGVALLLALILGMIVGDLNFWYHMQPVYDIENLNVYPSVNPAKERGGQLMDGGRMFFTDGTRLDFAKSMSFRNYDQYCVVPIVHGTEKLSSYDFWAVGLNCCKGLATEFRCGEFNNPKARSGLRLMRDTQRPFFRLAVQQAEAAYGISAQHPLFFYWMEDPTAEVKSYRDDGYKQFMVGIFTYFCFNLLCVAICVLVLSKMNSKSSPAGPAHPAHPAHLTHQL
jgi:hypothetical protein